MAGALGGRGLNVGDLVADHCIPDDVSEVVPITDDLLVVHDGVLHVTTYAGCGTAPSVRSCYRDDLDKATVRELLICFPTATSQRQDR